MSRGTLFCLALGGQYMDIFGDMILSTTVIIGVLLIFVTLLL